MFFRPFEHRRQRPISQLAFLRRLGERSAFSAIVIGGSLLIGMLGYHGLARMPWIDSFLNAAMILGGMGPVNELSTPASKLFAGFYALYAGVVFLVVAATMLTPVFHRVLHRFHWDAEHDSSPSST
jgi:sterol desaturase/sphingolipid hydroxylase (fatty acid hydroxylase superfamily)